ncbi:MAG: hypothetical protein Q9222_005225 [Ikaeria aurantiellina]
MPNNVLISYKAAADGSREVQRVCLADTETAAKLQENEAVYVQAFYGITKFVMFAYDDLMEGVLPEMEVLNNMLTYLGPLPPGLLEHIKKNQFWCQALIALEEDFGEDQPRKPLLLWKGFDELLPGDKEFFVRILNLDPALRPSAEELLNDTWFDEV